MKTRTIHVIVRPFYNTECGKSIPMSRDYFFLNVPQGISKRSFADNGNILHSIFYFNRFAGFSRHLLGKICFRITISEVSNNQSYTTHFTLC